MQAILDYPGIQDLNVYLVTFDWRGYGDHANRILDLERYINRVMQTDSPPVTGSDFGDQPLEERLKQMDESFSQMLLRECFQAALFQNPFCAELQAEKRDGSCFCHRAEAESG